MTRIESKATIENPMIDPLWIRAVIVAILVVLGFAVLGLVGSEELWLGLLAFLGFLVVYKDSRPFWHLDKQALKLTNHRVYGQAEHKSVNRFTSFSIPYSEIEDLTNTGFMKLALDIYVRGVRKPIRLWLVDDKLISSKWDAAVNHAGEPEILEEVGVVPGMGQAQIDRPDRGRTFGIGAAVVLVAVVLVGAAAFFVQPVFSLHSRYGAPDSLCVTAARLYQDNLRGGLRTLLERYDRAPERQLNRAVIVSLGSRFMENSYHDQTFADQGEGACLQRLFLHTLDEEAINVEIADAIETGIMKMMGVK